MGDSLLRRFWNAIKPPPPAPLRAWDVEAPSLWSRFWESLQPPPPLDAVPPKVQRRRRWIGTCAALALAIAALVVGVGSYIRSAPQRAETALQTGIRLAAAGDASLAADGFTRAIRIWPRSADAYHQRSLARQTLLDPEAALQDFDQAPRLNPRLAAAYVARGAIFRGRVDAQRALAEFSAAVAIQPGLTLITNEVRSTNRWAGMNLQFGTTAPPSPCVPPRPMSIVRAPPPNSIRVIPIRRPAIANTLTRLKVRLRR